MEEAGPSGRMVGKEREREPTRCTSVLTPQKLHQKRLGQREGHGKDRGERANERGSEPAKEQEYLLKSHRISANRTEGMRCDINVGQIVFAKLHGHLDTTETEQR